MYWSKKRHEIGFSCTNNLSCLCFFKNLKSNVVSFYHSYFPSQKSWWFSLKQKNTVRNEIRQISVLCFTSVQLLETTRIFDEHLTESMQQTKQLFLSLYQTILKSNTQMTYSNQALLWMSPTTFQYLALTVIQSGPGTAQLWNSTTTFINDFTSGKIQAVLWVVFYKYYMTCILITYSYCCPEIVKLMMSINWQDIVRDCATFWLILFLPEYTTSRLCP